MTDEVQLVRPLSRAAQAQALEALRQLPPSDWTASGVGAALTAALPAEVLRFLTPLREDHIARIATAADGASTGPSLAAISVLIASWRLVQSLEPDPMGNPPGAAVADLAGLASMLNLTATELDWFADEGQWLRRAPEPLRHYRVRKINKPNGGQRVIEAPKPRLREAQRRILRKILDPMQPHPAAIGFRPGGSVYRYAEPHVGRRTVLRFDLRDCFSTVQVPQVRQVFVRAGYPAAVARCLAALCTVSTAGNELIGLDGWHAATLRARHLPQGAPSSPALVNMVLRRLDARLSGLAAAQGATYTRYGDDLAFSGQTDQTLIAVVVPKIVASEGFAINPRKTAIMPLGRRQELAGIVVNERAQAPRSEYDTLRALLHNAGKYGAQSQNREQHADFRGQVYGRIAWVGQGNPGRRERLLTMASAVDW